MDKMLDDDVNRAYKSCNNNCGSSCYGGGCGNNSYSSSRSASPYGRSSGYNHDEEEFD